MAAARIARSTAMMAQEPVFISTQYAPPRGCFVLANGSFLTSEGSTSSKGGLLSCHSLDRHQVNSKDAVPPRLMMWRNPWQTRFDLQIHSSVIVSPPP